MLLQYMYRGEINVLQEDLGPLIETAKALQVKGLADAPTSGSGGGGGSNKQSPLTGAQKRKAKMPPMPKLPPPLKKGNFPSLLPGLPNLLESKPLRPESLLKPNQFASQLAHRLTQQQPASAAKRPPFPMPQLPTEPEPIENINIKEDQIDLWGSPVIGEQPPEGDGGDGEFEAYTDAELPNDQDANDKVG